MDRTEKMIACRFCNYEGRMSSKNTTLLFFRTRDMTIHEGKNLLLKGANGRGYHVLVINADVKYEKDYWMKKWLEAVRIVRDGKTMSELAEEEKNAAEKAKLRNPSTASGPPPFDKGGKTPERKRTQPEAVQLTLY
jgi:hypothetical protein